MAASSRDSGGSVDISPERDIVQQLRELLAEANAGQLADWIESLEPGQIARALSDLTTEEQNYLFLLLDPEDAADLIDDLPDQQSADLLEEMSSDQAAAIVEELDSDDRADVLAEMDDDDAAAILDAMPLEEASEARELLKYAGDTAGGVMVKEYVAYLSGTTVSEVLEDMRANYEDYSYYDVRYFYVIGDHGVLKGVLRLRDIVLSPGYRLIDDVMIKTPDVVSVDEDLNTLQHRLETETYSALPVVDEAGRLLGVAIEKEVAEAARKFANRNMLKLAGIFGGEELRSMDTWPRAWARLIWLFGILLLSILAASVIKGFEATLQHNITLAMFLPVVAGMSGSQGNQSMALSLREMTLGVIRPWDLTYVLMKEVWVGLINGMVLGLSLGTIAYMLNGFTDIHVPIVVGSALIINTPCAVCLGGILPLLLKRFGMDPATAGGPILTTIIDTGGFFLVLGVAALLL